MHIGRLGSLVAISLGLATVTTYSILHASGRETSPVLEVATARLSFGFEVPQGSPYLGPLWTDEDRIEFKQIVLDEVKEKVLQSYLDFWEAFPIQVRSGGHLAEHEVVDGLRFQLETLSNDTSSSFQLKLEGDGVPPWSSPPPSPVEVTYVFYDNTRKCIHTYAVEWKEINSPGFTPWTVAHDPTPGNPNNGDLVSAQIFAQLSWPTLLQ